jgi:hypothetical protein
MKNRAIIILVAVVVILIILLQNQCQQNVSLNETWQAALNDTISYYIDEQGRQTASILTLEGSLSDIKAINAGKDTTITRLQELLREANAIAATVSTVVTSVTDTTPTVIIRADTIIENGITFVWPVYKNHFKNQWWDLTITSGKDTSSIEGTVTNEFDVWFERKKRLFKPNQLTVKWRNNNPYSSTTELRSWSQSVKQKRFGLGIYAGYGITSDLKPRPSFGVGISYNLITF